MRFVEDGVARCISYYLRRGLGDYGDEYQRYFSGGDTSYDTTLVGLFSKLWPHHYLF